MVKVMGKRLSASVGTLIAFESADPLCVLEILIQNGIQIRNIVWHNDLTVQICVSPHKTKRILTLLRNRAENVRILRSTALRKYTGVLFHRPVLLIGLLLILFLSIYLPGRVLFIQVEGNDTIPTQQIIEAAQNCGIRFGSSRKDVRSEKVKNALISHIPQLNWVGVNTRGCVAILSVREADPEDPIKTEHPVGNVVASRDGVIISATTLRGTPVCKPGQAVTEGQLLISGYTDCGIYVQATCADGEILAQTNHQITVLTPRKYQSRGGLLATKRQYQLKIGNYLINLYKGSGISDTACVKIRNEQNLCLPGGFSLPIGMIYEEFLFYQTEESTADARWLRESAGEYLKKLMVAGTIISEDIKITETGTLFLLSGRYACTEMIGQIKFEESTNAYGYDRQNR